MQRRFIKMIPGFRNKSYEEKLGIRKKRQNRADLIFFFKMYKGLFQLTKLNRIRRHTLKLTKHCTSKDVRLRFFSKKVIIDYSQEKALDKVQVLLNIIYKNHKMVIFTKPH